MNTGLLQVASVELLRPAWDDVLANDRDDGVLGAGVSRFARDADARLERMVWTGSGRLAQWVAAAHRPCGDHHRDVEAAAEEARGEALVEPAAGGPVKISNTTIARAWRDYGCSRDGPRR